MQRYIAIIFVLIILPRWVWAGITLDQAMQMVRKHASIQIQQQEVERTKQGAISSGSWGDPRLKIAAKNFTAENFRKDLSPMSGIEVSVSQKMALTNRYGKQRAAIEKLAQAQQSKQSDKINKMREAIWLELIAIDRLKKDIKIIKENRGWVKLSLKVGEKLYSLGKVTQQSVIQIQLKEDLLQRKYLAFQNRLSEHWQRILYFTGGQKIIWSSIDWNTIGHTYSSSDYKQLQLSHRVEASTLGLEAERLKVIPDVTLSAGYTKRENLDGLGDMVSVGITIPLPFSDKTSSNIGVKKYQLERQRFALDDYRKQREMSLAILQLKIESIRKRVSLLIKSSIPMAEQSRKITFKLYERGKASYLDLLNAYEKNLSLELKKNLLQANLLENRVKQAALKGDIYEK